MVRQHVLEPLSGCEPVIGSWLSALEDARSRTRRVLDGLPAAALDWVDSCSPHTVGTLLYHIAAIEADWLFADVLGTGFPAAIAALFPHDVRDANGRLTIVKGETLSNYLERLQVVRQSLLAVYQPMSLEDFRRARVLSDYEVTPEWVLHHLCQHEAEHRTELVALRERYEAAQ